MGTHKFQMTRLGIQIYLAAALLFASAHAQRDALLTTEDKLALDVDLTETASCMNLPTDVFNPDCSLTTNKLDEIASQIVFVGKSSHPKWKVYEDNAKSENRIAGYVSCPCKANGATMGRSQAMAVIAGQLAAKLSFISDKSAYAVAMDRGKLGLASVKMFLCWQSTCKPSRLASADVQLDLDENDSWGGGVKGDTQLDDLLENSEGADVGWNSCRPGCPGCCKR